MKKKITNKILSVVLVILLVLSNFTALGSFIGVYAEDTYTVVSENFISLGTNETASLPTDWKVSKDSSNVRKVGDYNSATTATERAGSNIGTTASNGIYNLGATADYTHRAVGFLSSGSGTKSGNLYYKWMNNTGSDLNSFDISYTVEKFRNGSNPAGFSIALYYSVDGANWTYAGDNFKVSYPADSNNNGSATVPISSSTVDDTLVTSLQNGDAIYFAWNYSVSSGTTTTNSQALGVTDVLITAQGDPAAPDTEAPSIIDKTKDTAMAGSPIPIRATITDNKSAVDSIHATVFYGTSIDGHTFTDSVEMTSVSGDDFTADIPSQSSDIYYYIKAWDGSNNSSTYPSDIANSNKITVSATDAAPPVITHTPVTNGIETVGIKIDATITDDSLIDAELFYGLSADGVTFTDHISMTNAGGNNYSATIANPAAGDVYYYIKATDSNENSATYPANISSSNKITVDGIMDISAARTHAVNDLVVVKGIVTFIDGSNNYIQDGTAGIDLYKAGLTSSISVGDEVIVKGKIDVYRGLLEVVPVNLTDVVKVSSGNALPDPQTVTIDQIGAEYDCERVKIEAVTLGPINTSSDTQITDSSSHTINIYKIPALSGIVAGDTVDVIAVAAKYNTIYQLRVRQAADVAKAVQGPDLVPPVITHTPVTNGNKGLDFAIAATITDNRQLAYETVFYRTKGTTTYSSLSMTKGTENTYSATIPKESLDIAGLEYYIEASDGTNVVTSPLNINTPYDVVISNVDTVAPTITNMLPTDRSSTGDDKRPTISANYSDDNIGIDSAKVKLTLDNADVTSSAAVSATGISYTPAADMADGSHTVKLEVSDLNSNKAEKTWSFYVGEAVYKNYFGQLHSHTAENSDGAGTLAEAYTYARDTAGLDFFAVTDHSNSFDTNNAADKAGTYNLGDYNKNNPKWVNGQQAAANARRDNFISVYAYEMTWSGGPGHINTFATDGFVSRNNTELNAKANDAGLKAYYQLLKNTPNSISQFNHPGATFGNFSDFAYLDPMIDARISLVEVGNGEGAVGSGAYFPSYDEYNKALDKGWHLAPTNNQDNHKGKWGDSNSARTVIYTNDLSVEGLYDALRDMRVYATEDEDLDIEYTLNGELLGSIIEAVPAQADIEVSVKDPDSADEIQSVSIISNGGEEIYSQTYSTQNATLDTIIDSPAAGYYYIRVVETDGQIAVTAPIWLGSAPKVGIDSVQYNTLMPVTGEPVIFTTKLFNNESTAAMIKSLTYEIKDGGTIAANDINESIASNGMYTHTQSHTFTEPGNVTVTVTAVISQNGIDTTYTKDIEVSVRDSEKLVYVGVDASHDNEYVSGNYKASMGNFAKLAAKFNVRVTELNTSEELISAMQNPKYKMMVFTVPSRRNGSTGRIPFKSYSQDEIDAVKAFAESGNTVVATGWGDYYENYSNLKSNPGFTVDQHMAAQQNKLLTAIGASLRIADDEAKDNSKNGGQPQRLYLTDYNNFVDPFTQGIVDGQVFSQYGGSTIYAADSDGNPLSELPSNIKPTISGHATTYSSNDDGDANAVPPKYNDRVLLMANETVTHEDGTKSTVIASGGAFMSNFEIQVEVENAGTLPYSNYNILLNILASTTYISPIAEVRNMPNGTDVVIEGIATTDVYNGSDSNKGFFDCIYVEDETGGINLFPVSSGVEVGQKIRVTGRISEYQGEKQLQNVKVTVINSGKNPVVPKTVTPQQAMDAENTGSLITFSGNVTEIKIGDDGVVGQLMVNGARVYINGYITKNVSLSNIKIGDTVNVTGIASIGENMSSDTEFLPRIRIRDRSEIKIVEPAPIKVTGVRLNKETTAVEVGKTTTLTATIEPADAANKALTWSSSDETLATVNNGVVTGVKEGIATITVTTQDGGHTASCVVTVNPVAVTGITLDKSDAEVKIGRDIALVATILPADAKNKNIVWTSDKPKIAKVQDGKVTGVAEGIAVITATTADGGFTANCTVKVVPVKVEGISLDMTQADMKVGDSLNLIATINPTDATNKNITWTTSDSSIAKVENGVVTAVAGGNAIITVTTTDGGFKATCNIKVRPLTTLKVIDFKQSLGKLTVAFGLNGAKDVAAQDIIISYDINAIKLQKITMLQSGLQLIQQRSKHDGTVRLIISSNGSRTLISGDKNIFAMDFKTVKGYDTANVSVVSAILSNGQGIEVNAEPIAIKVDTRTGKAIVQGKKATDLIVNAAAGIENMSYPISRLTISYDVNGDGKISIGDLGIVAYNMGKTRQSKDWDKIKAADVVKNGIIGYEDLLVIVKELLK